MSVPLIRLGTHAIRQMPIAAILIAAINVWAHRSYRVAIRCQSLSLPNIFSALCRCRYRILSYSISCFRFFPGGMQGVIFFSGQASRNQSASSPLSANKCQAGGKSPTRAAAPLYQFHKIKTRWTWRVSRFCDSRKDTVLEIYPGSAPSAASG